MTKRKGDVESAGANKIVVFEGAGLINTSGPPDLVDLDVAADKLCQSWKPEFSVYRFWDVSRLDPNGSWLASYQFMAFSKQFRPKFHKFMEKFSRVGIYPIQDVLPPPPDSLPYAHVPIGIPYDVNDVIIRKKIFDENILRCYQNFNHFGTVVDFSDHFFSSRPMRKATQVWDECIQKQLKNLEENLPETMFVRTYESRKDLLRVVIIGQKGTPYHDGLFFFDIYFPPMFPTQPPVVRYHSFGLGINPHLFECGEVRLNLYRESSHPDRSLWPPHSDTSILQLLLSIQDRVLCADPLFLEPGFLDSGPSVAAEYLSLLYNEDILIKSFQLMAYIMHKPPKHFEAFVLGYFHNHVVDILLARPFYKRGELAIGAVKEGCRSYEFRMNLDRWATLQKAFANIRTNQTYHINFSPPTNTVSGYLNLFKPSVKTATDEIGPTHKRPKNATEETPLHGSGHVKVEETLVAGGSDSSSVNIEDLEKVDPDDVEEMDLKFQTAMLNLRIKRFTKRTGRNINMNSRTMRVGFDKSKASKT